MVQQIKFTLQAAHTLLKAAQAASRDDDDEQQQQRLGPIEEAIRILEQHPAIPKSKVKVKRMLAHAS